MSSWRSALLWICSTRYQEPEEDGPATGDEQGTGSAFVREPCSHDIAGTGATMELGMTQPHCTRSGRMVAAPGVIALTAEQQRDESAGC